MIVRPDADRIQLITQPDHAQLSRAIMEHCVPLAARPRRETILHAIAQHDNGWTEEDAAPRVNPATGEVLDFITASIDVRHRVWPRAVNRLGADPWAAALVAQHAITIYDRHRGDADWASFFARMAMMRDEALHDVGTLEDLLDDYVFVRLADLVSLTFCTGWTYEQRVGAWTVRPSGARVSVSAGVLGGVDIPIAIDAREIRNRPYRSDAELRDALNTAKTVTLRGMVA